MFIRKADHNREQSLQKYVFFFFLKTQSINEIKFNGALEEQGSVVGGSKRERELKLRETKDGKMYKVKGQDAGSITQTLIVACQ